MLKKFAKLDDTEIGQILVTLENNYAGEPTIYVQFKPDGLGVCKIGVSHTDNNSGRERIYAEFFARNVEDFVPIVESFLMELESYGD